MDRRVKKKITAAQVSALVNFMQEHSDVAHGVANSGSCVDREDMAAQWRDLAANLNAMGGAVKSIEKWKQKCSDLKANTKKQALKKQSFCNTSVGPSLENSQGVEQCADGDNYIPPKKKLATFDEEIIKIEREKLEVDKAYKVQKIEVLSRIASALEELARSKEK